MKFRDSGLPNDATVERAFNYSLAHIMSSHADEMKNFSQQMAMSHEQNMAMLDMEKKMGMAEEDYKRQKEAMERMFNEQMKMGPRLVDDALNSMFRYRRLGPALELQEHSDDASPELLAATLLIECVRSPVDYKRIAKEFGEGIAGLLAEVHHIDAYPSERDINLPAAGSDTKRAYTALLISTMSQITLQMKQGMQALIPPGYEEGMFGSARMLRGNDSKLDQRFFDAFNGMAEAVASPFRMEIGTDGELELVKGNLTPPNDPGFTPPEPGGKAGIGDDIF